MTEKGLLDWLAGYPYAQEDKIIIKAIDDLHKGNVYDLADAFK